MALQVRASHINQIIDGIGSSQRCPKYRFFARTDHIEIIEVRMLWADICDGTAIEYYKVGVTPASPTARDSNGSVSAKLRLR